MRDFFSAWGSSLSYLTSARVSFHSYLSASVPQNVISYGVYGSPGTYLVRGVMRDEVYGDSTES
ncbi:unnamed protein product [Acanthoscelides obtectus]|uniref:Uncharacterized protein n=1 Tax=Acanthoscelides obtectus TaxID=200917 RepID=A0A9P0KI93_ACAOB|nr:unnamed protein product [Acanthoscelides obtectus]CAK1646325.1 hypothetical protein AOBTE_LOCUS14587 [Acanthoscelides obtectus]